MDIRSYLQHNTLLFDGAMGTYFSAQSENPNYPSEYANFTSPHTIRAIHRRYLQAGAMAIRTNSFSLHLGEDCAYDAAAIVTAAYKLAQQEVADTGAYLFCSLGPPPALGGDCLAVYQQALDRFIALGGRHFLFETFASCTLVNQLVHYLKEKDASFFVMASYAVDPNGVSKTGALLADLMQQSSPLFDAIGLNCICGPHHMALHMQSAARLQLGKPLSAMANASYPTVLGRRVSYHQNPQYFAQQMQTVQASGAAIIGGCCGTTPEFIAQLRKSLDHEGWQNVPQAVTNATPESGAMIRKSHFYEALTTQQKPIAVELDPPARWDIAPFLASAKKLQEAGANLITIADCPVARARMDSSILSCKLKRELGLEVMPHMTCRDRNFNATMALLLGLSMEEVADILIVTGDPIPTAQRDEVKAVYESNSRMLMGHISSLHQTSFASPFYLYGALNINATNIDVQLRLAKQKIEKGAMAFFTQPVLSETGLENLKKAKAELAVPIVGGILPIVSHRNALFLNNEIPGISVSGEIIDRYAGKTKEECTALAVELSTEFAAQMAPYVDGYYLITPFQRVDIITALMRNIREGSSVYKAEELLK